MKKSSHQLGFWGLFSIVIGSQIGSGVFMLPSTLAPFGYYAFAGWLTAGAGALALTMVFVKLVERFPKTGGPHVYAQQALGVDVAFFTGWTYWVISSVSSVTVVLAALGYLSPILGVLSPHTSAACQLMLLFAVMVLNLYGVDQAGSAETLLAIIKIFTLIVIPVFALLYFNVDHIATSSSLLQEASALNLTGQATLLTLWAFIGLETATTPAESTVNPKFTIPAAMLSGTTCVLLLYLLNSIALQGLIPFSVLEQSQAPYVDAAKLLLGGEWSAAVGVFAALVCLSNLNAWILTSGQIALGLAQDGFLPPVFKECNTYGAPKFGLFVSCAMIALLILTSMDSSLLSQVIYIINISVTAFLYVYLVCCASLLVLLWREAKPWYNEEYYFALCAGFFCLYLIFTTAWTINLVALLFILSGIPIYLLRPTWHLAKPV
ncbi:MAG: amino acid permease [Pseudomonadota bacterium]|nr:amino acid permease [Pseudomonadota bacterium]